MRSNGIRLGAVLILGAVFTPLPATAATTVGTPTPGQGNCYPFGCNSVSTSDSADIDYYQIFSAAAFTEPLTFDTISFRDSGLNYSGFFSSPPSPNLLAGAYNISFSTTTDPLGSTFPVADLMNTQTFFLGGLSASPTYSGISISGSTYTYDPSMGNLVLHVIASNQAPTPNNGNVGYLAEDISGTTLSRAYSEVNAQGVGMTNADQDGLVTTFSLGLVTSAVPEPGLWAMLIAGFGAIGGMMRWNRKLVKRADLLAAN